MDQISEKACIVKLNFMTHSLLSLLVPPIFVPIKEIIILLQIHLGIMHCTKVGLARPIAILSEGLASNTIITHAITSLHGIATAHTMCILRLSWDQEIEIH